MTHFDFSPLFRSTIGFDRFTDLLENSLSESPRASYPPYDVEVVDEDKYRITMAVAGFNQDEIHIEVNQQELTVTGQRPEPTEAPRYLHRGIARRGFSQKFQLADYVKVVGADLNNGLLTISLEREVPEAMKPRTIQIGTTPSLTDTDDTTVQAA